MDVHTYKRWQRVWKWWRETAEFGLEPNWYTRIEDAPENSPDGSRVNVMNETRTEYERRLGKWEKVQEITAEDCKRIYE